ncbi:hypothetical protein SAMN04488034_10239 [Salinimicrobium catena]|uniref:DUF4890 domain-containing protein n=1 Tax=Salinimicrobium catena TaxID=390640 RepID=A0A1H5KWX2_9FLAO|nr:hypothetical protein [Salinimicrobium catena]SDL03015.1 hypothetical protein SAMN04488140_10239 [Salinimicrobium catena]SEE69286.1 hypothetical protein SAMN04488034_10239 [Salinimicrobium catena]
MRLNRKYRLLIVFTISFMATAAVVAQNITQHDPDKQLREAAREATQYWEKELSLTAKQANLMEKKIIEFAIKKNKLIQSKMREEAKTKRLRRLQELEYKDMRDILTGPQYERYLSLSKERIRKQNRRH